MAEKKKKNKKSKKVGDKLTPKMIRFCREYSVFNDAKRAAINAKYSEKSAGSQGSYLLTIPKIKEKIEEFRKEAIERNKLSADEILASIAKTANDKIGNYCSWKTDTITVKDPMTGMESRSEQVVVTWKDSDQIDTSNIKKIGFDKQGRFNIELHDSFTAKKTLGEWAGLNKVKEEKGNKEENAELTHLLEEGE